MLKTCYGAAGNRWANFVAVDYYKVGFKDILSLLPKFVAKASIFDHNPYILIIWGANYAEE